MSEVWVFSWAQAALVTALLLLAAWAAGRRLLALIVDEGRRSGSATYTSLGLGLGMTSAIVFALGTIDWLSRWPLGVLLVPAAVLGAFDLRLSTVAWLRKARTRYGFVDPLVILLPLLPAFVYATLPPVFYDAMVYHLGLPNLHLSSGSLVYPASFSLAGHPQNAELILLPALAFGGEVGARLTAFAVTVLAALLVRRLVLDRFGRLSANLAYVLLVSQWFFTFQAVFLKVDLVGGFFLLSGIAAILDAPEGQGTRAWVLGGVLAGLSVGTKFPNLMPVALVAASLPWIVGSRRRLTRGALYVCVALVVASPWMVRNIIHRGNPLFPAFYDVLGGSGWNEANAERMARDTGMSTDRSVAGRAERLVKIGWGRGYGSGGELSRAWIPLLLAGLVAARRKDVRWLLAFAAVGVIVGVMFFSLYLRIYVWALVLVPVAVAALWDRLRAPPARIVIAIVVAAIAVPGFIKSTTLLEVVSGRGSRVLRGEMGPGDYLVDRLSYTPVARYINESLPADARIRMIGTARTAYIRRPCIASYIWDDPFAATLRDDDASTRKALDRLRSEGFTHVVLDTGEMDRLERSIGLYGYSEAEGGRNGIDRFLRALEMEVEANGVYLFRVPAAD